MVARTRAHRGDQFKDRGRVGAAVIEYRRALSDAPDSVPILNRLSSVLIGMDRDKEAFDLLIRARDLSPDHPTAYTTLGKVFLKKKEFKAAAESFQASIQINPFNPEIHLGLAEAYDMTGRKADSLKEREIGKKLMH